MKPIPIPESPTGCLKLAVVGHTNTGKTSLLRTLTRNPLFGEVDNQPGTTRHVEAVSLSAGGIPVLQLFDTPGIEDSVGLRDYLSQLDNSRQRLDGPDKIQRFLETPESRRRYEQEARVLRQLLNSDAALYVVDVRDPVLAKHKDELAILTACGRPLLPVLNFLHNEAEQATLWRQALANLGLHVSIEFDTIAPSLEGEDQLYQKLAILLEHHATQLEQLRKDIRHERYLRKQGAIRLIAELLIDTAALRITYKPGQTALEQVTTQLHQQVRQREQQCVTALLQLYNFHEGDFPAHPTPLKDGSWPLDLFSTDALRQMGLQLGKGMATGAAAGFTIDALTGGLSLGTATLVGAAAGGLWQGANRFGKQLLGHWQGHQDLIVDTPVLCLLALRQLTLMDALNRRGHAAIAPVSLVAEHTIESRSNWQQNRLPTVLKEARQHPEWSQLSPTYKPGPAREQAIELLSASLI